MSSPFNQTSDRLKGNRSCLPSTFMLTLCSSYAHNPICISVHYICFNITIYVTCSKYAVILPYRTWFIVQDVSINTSYTKENLSILIYHRGALNSDLFDPKVACYQLSHPCLSNVLLNYIFTFWMILKAENQKILKRKLKLLSPCWGSTLRWCSSWSKQKII